MTDVMIDLEFLGKPPSARIASIGACEFDIATGEIGRQFYKRVRWADKDDQLLPMCPSTVHWWLQQDRNALTEITDRNHREHLNDALRAFGLWYPEKATVWGNGDDCDCVIMADAYDNHPIAGKLPWRFFDTRDVRTIVDLCKRVNSVDVKELIPFEGTKHHALHDAIHQAKYVSLAFQMLQMR